MRTGQEEGGAGSDEGPPQNIEIRNARLQGPFDANHLFSLMRALDGEIGRRVSKDRFLYWAGQTLKIPGGLAVGSMTVHARTIKGVKLVYHVDDRGGFVTNKPENVLFQELLWPGFRLWEQIKAT